MTIPACCSVLTAAGALVLACQSSPPPPLGSRDNPVRADGFRGELEYLGRLRCRDGSTPQTQGLVQRHTGAGPLVEAFRVRCIYMNEEVVVHFDASHPEYVESRAIAGFTLVEDGFHPPR